MFGKVSGNPGDSFRKTPPGYRALFWALILDVLFLTALVWRTAFALVDAARNGASVLPAEQFMRFLLGYHVLLLVWSILAWLTQLLWRAAGTMALFPLALVLLTLSLDLAALTALSACW